jgi:hypothetical protein
MSYRKSPLDETWDVHDISGMEGIKFDLIQLIDLDGDGDLDVIKPRKRPAAKGWVSCGMKTRLGEKRETCEGTPPTELFPALVV